MSKKSDKVFVMRRGAPIQIDRAIWEYTQRKRRERKLERKRKEQEALKNGIQVK